MQGWIRRQGSVYSKNRNLTILEFRPNNTLPELCPDHSDSFLSKPGRPRSAVEIRPGAAWFSRNPFHDIIRNKASTSGGGDMPFIDSKVTMKMTPGQKESRERLGMDRRQFLI